MSFRYFVAIVPMLFALQPITASAASKHPIFCDEIHVKVCRPPAVVGGVYPHCFCSVEALPASRSNSTANVGKSKVIQSCENKCSANSSRCKNNVAKMCNILHHPCDDVGLEAQQEAAAACESTLQDCLANCAQPPQ